MFLTEYLLCIILFSFLELCFYSPLLTLPEVFGPREGGEDLSGRSPPAAGKGADAELRIFNGDGQRFNPAELLLRPGMDAVVSGEFLSRRLSLGLLVGLRRLS